MSPSRLLIGCFFLAGSIVSKNIDNLQGIQHDIVDTLDNSVTSSLNIINIIKNQTIKSNLGFLHFLVSILN